MNYRPNPKELLLWDTWMFPDPDGRRMHLFFLANLPDKPWEWAGHAISEDLVHWTDLPPVQFRRPGDSFDVGVVGTGMVFAAPSGGFMMSYTANLDGKRQSICFLHSQDLIHWDKLWQEPCIVAQPPHYEPDGSQCVSNPPAFRDAFIQRVGDHYEALVGAHTTRGPKLLRGCIARYKSTDPTLRKWEPMAPLIGPGVMSLMEVPEHFEIAGKHYLLWSNAYWLAGGCDLRTRRQCTGTFYAMSDSYEGPYTVPDDNLLIGASQAFQSYVGRIITWQGERLLYHHQCWPSSSAGLPKRIVQEKDGTLKTAYWPGVEKIHASEVSLPIDQIAVQGDNLRAGDWKKMGASSLVGSIDGGGTFGLLPVSLEDAHLRCKVTVESATRFGITMRELGHAKNRKEGDPKEAQGVALQGDLKYGEWQFGTPQHCWTSRIDPNETILEAPEAGRTYTIDLLVRDIYFEAYVDGIWRFTRIINDRTRRGGIGFFVENGTVRFEDIRVWNLEPINNPFPDEWPKAK